MVEMQDKMLASFQEEVGISSAEVHDPDIISEGFQSVLLQRFSRSRNLILPNMTFQPELLSGRVYTRCLLRSSVTRHEP